MRVLALLVAWSCAGGRAPEVSAVSGEVRWPPIIDSHVHLQYWPIAGQLAASGIGAVVDLAAPEASLGVAAPLTVIASGPMLTRPGGYPLDSWGSDGYGTGCADVACVEAAIDRLANKGARVIKLAAGDDGLASALLAPAVRRAHARHLIVAAHALDDAAARRAGEAGVDVLAHTPVEPLAEATIEAWRGKAVISTLAAFGAPEAVGNLRRLRAAGCTVLYGTDLGNLRDAGPSARELELLRQAGLDDAAITAAMTTAPAAFWEISRDATSYLVLERDPRVDAGVLIRPREVWMGGRRIR